MSTSTSAPAEFLPPGFEEVIWRERVKEVIVQEYGKKAKDTESMIRLFIYLERDLANNTSTSTTPSAWTELITVLQINPTSFKKVADDFIECSKSDPELDEAYKEVLKGIIGEVGASGALILKDPLPDADGFEVVGKSDYITLGIRTLCRSILPLNLLKQIMTNRGAILSVDEFVNLVNKSTGTVIMVGLAGLHVSLVAIHQLISWWNGKITGVRCIKGIVDTTVTVTAGVVGGMAGGAMGASVGGPIGSLVGGIVGGIWTAERAHAFIDRMTQKIFGIPRDAALENAYKFFGLELEASNEEINKVFRAMCLKHHPDKGGKSEDFIEVQLHMGVIKLARGDLTATP